jgi:hypothetical protein
MFTKKSISNIHSLTIFLTLLALTFSSIGVTPTHAATFIVTTVYDSGAGSLRQAIVDAPNGSTITFASGLSGAEIHLATELIIYKNVTINGSALAFPIAISGDTNGDLIGDVRVFDVTSAGTATLDSLIIKRGLGNFGGGIYNNGVLAVTNCTFSDNSADYGGGIYNSGTLAVMNSTLSGNSAPSGGGIYNENGSILTVTNSTLSGNSATNGGGIYNNGALIVTNNTLTGNSANIDGGGIYNFISGTANVYNISIAFNEADADADSDGIGAGVYNYAGATFNLRNSVVAGNYLAGAPVYNDCTGVLGIYGSNRFSNTDGCTATPGSPGSAFFIGSLAELGILANNGGPTKTIALVPPSNMIDGGVVCSDQNGNTLLTDQRGFARVVGAHCDIGAFEYSPLLHIYLPLILR